MIDVFPKLRAPSLDDMEMLAQDALLTLPDAYREVAQLVVLRIEDFPPDDLLQEMEISNPYELTGLYDGIPLTEKSVMDQPTAPDVIWLFRRPILDEWAERGNVALGDLVTHVLVHELAHHFGWSDEDIGAVDAWWE